MLPEFRNWVNFVVSDCERCGHNIGEQHLAMPIMPGMPIMPVMPTMMVVLIALIVMIVVDCADRGRM